MAYVELQTLLEREPGLKEPIRELIRDPRDQEALTELMPFLGADAAHLLKAADHRQQLRNVRRLADVDVAGLVERVRQSNDEIQELERARAEIERKLESAREARRTIDSQAERVRNDALTVARNLKLLGDFRLLFEDEANAALRHVGPLL